MTIDVVRFENAAVNKKWGIHEDEEIKSCRFATEEAARQEAFKLRVTKRIAIEIPEAIDGKLSVLAALWVTTNQDFQAAVSPAFMANCVKDAMHKLLGHDNNHSRIYNMLKTLIDTQGAELKKAPDIEKLARQLGRKDTELVAGTGMNKDQ